MRKGIGPNNLGSPAKQLKKFREDKGKKPKPQSLHDSDKGKKIGKVIKSGRIPGEKPKGVAKQVKSKKEMRYAKLAQKAENAAVTDKMRKNSRLIDKANKLNKKNNLGKGKLAKG